MKVLDDTQLLHGIKAKDWGKGGAHVHFCWILSLFQTVVGSRTFLNEFHDLSLIQCSVLACFGLPERSFFHFCFTPAAQQGQKCLLQSKQSTASHCSLLGGLVEFLASKTSQSRSPKLLKPWCLGPFASRSNRGCGDLWEFLRCLLVVYSMFFCLARLRVEV